MQVLTTFYHKQRFNRALLIRPIQNLTIADINCN